MLGRRQKKFEVMYNGNTLIYVFQPPVEDCIQYSLPFAEVGQRRAMKIEHGKSLLWKVTEKKVRGLGFFLI